MHEKQKLITKWIENAKWSPSGGNLQPWLFILDFDNSQNSLDIITLHLVLNPNAIKERSPLDVSGTASLISLGCITTSIKHIAALDSYRLEIEVIEKDHSYVDTSIKLTFIQDLSLKNHQFKLDHILNRSTNREPFKKKKIDENITKELVSILESFANLKLFNILNKKDFFKIYKEIEKIRWKNNQYVDSLFTEINFKEKTHEFSNKIPLSQLGLSFIDKLFFGGLNHFIFLRRICQFLLADLLVFKSLKNYRSKGSEIFFLQAKTHDVKSLFELGCLFQEIWLLTEKNHLAFQPLGTSLIMASQVIQDDTLNLTSKENDQIKKIISNLNKISGENFNYFTLGFRIGYPTKKTKRSPRKELNSIVKIINKLFILKNSA